ncbi:LamG domain-containing protein [Novipirellula sp. SH528]|uniref:LamG domain-containing protein n=1 Tax=Novipirellula sp. SH528 TaxID=3454466 RepID=UPI003F9F5F5D
MNTDNHQLQTLRTLILKSQSESLSESEIAELNALICSEEGAVEAAALIDQLCAFTDSGGLDSLPMAEVLSEAFSQEKRRGTLSAAANPPSPKNVPGTLAGAIAPLSRERADSSSQPDRWTKAYWWVGLAASHLFIASLAWSLAKPSSVNAPIANLPSANLPAAGFTSEARPPQLVSMTACVWSSSSDLVPTIGEPIASGEVLNLVEGIAELRIGEKTPGEAIVRIEGPASVSIGVDGKIGLLHGSMTAKSLGTGSGNVTVNTSMGKVLADGQSSIGLVSSDSETEVHLFSGRVSVKPNQAEFSTNEIHLEAGEAVRISSNFEEGVTVVKFEASEANFVSARSPGFDPLNLGEEYVRAVLDSQPNIYWRFEELKGEFSQFVENQGSAPGMNAMVVGNPGWRKYDTNRVAEMGTSTSSAFRAVEPWPEKPLDEYTIEMWVKPQLFHHGEVFCMHATEGLADGRYPHTMMLETTAQHYFTHRLSDSPANRFRFVHRALRSDEPISVTSLFSGNQYQARLWQHVVSQKQGSRQMLWINGQLSAEHSNPAPLTENVQILVGQVYPTSVYRRFVGQIDEVAIYDRCLPPKELRSHIKAAGRSVASEVLD